MLPIFPPQEDVHVGDVWAVVADADENYLLGKGMRIGYLPLKGGVDVNRRPVFPDTAEIGNDQDYRHQDRRQVEPGTADDRINLTLIAFPGITIARTVKRSASIGAKLFGLSAGRDESVIDELSIPTAETYGVPSGQAVGALSKWCQDEETRLYCSDAYIRRLMAFTVSEQFLTNRAEFQLRVVTRVFLTRSIVQRRRLSGSQGAASEIGAGFTRPDVSTSGDPDASVRDTKPPATVDAAASSAAEAREAKLRATIAQGADRSGLSFVNGHAWTVGLQQTFQRPLVFGFKAVTMRIKPDLPEQKAKP